MQLNFNGGQVSENFTPRVDMQKYQTSCSLMRNFQVCLPKRQNVDSASRLLPAGINKDSHTGENA